MKKTILIVLLISVVFISGCIQGDVDSGTGSVPLDPWLSCDSDSDCIENLDSWSCCANKDYVGILNITGECRTEKYLGYCKCKVPEGWDSGYCTGLNETYVPPEVNGTATRKD